MKQVRTLRSVAQTGSPVNNLQRFYDDRYRGDYMHGFDSTERLRRRYVREVLHGLGLSPTAVLDAGCGRGRYSEVIWELYPDCALRGCDISPVAIEQCRMTFARGDFQVSSEHRMPFADATFDLVISIEVMEHVKDIEIYVREVSRVLRSGGTFVFTTPCANPLSYEWILVAMRRSGSSPTPDGYRRWYYEDSAHLRRMTSNEVESVLTRNGLRRREFYFWSHYLGAWNWMYGEVLRQPGRRFVRLRRRLRFAGALLDALAVLEWRLLKRAPNGASMIGVFSKGAPTAEC